MAAKVTLKAGLATEVEQQLVQEMRVLRALVHPNIIRMHASHETDEKLSPNPRVECSRHILLLECHSSSVPAAPTTACSWALHVAPEPGVYTRPSDHALTTRPRRLIMERASSDLLECLHRDGPFSEAGTRRLGRQLLRALEACHAHGLIPRDVKPENLLLFGDPHAEDGVLKLADFGTVHRAP